MNCQVVNNTLKFESTKDYENAIEYLNTLPESKYNEFELNLGFKSMRTHYRNSENKTNIPIDSDLFASLLNPEGKIIIANQLLEIDAFNQKIFINDYEETNNNDVKSAKNNATKQLSFDDDALVVLDGGISDKTDYCDGMKQYHMSYTSNGTVETVLHYQKFGLYYRLKAEVVKNQNSVTSYVYLHSKVEAWTRNSYHSKAAGSTEEGLEGDRSCELVMYSGTKRLKKYIANDVECAWDDTGYPDNSFSGSRWYSAECNN